jgi:hypothetical protein
LDLLFFADTQTSDNISFEVSIRVTFHSHVTVQSNGGCCGRDRMVVGLITTYAISAYHLYRCEIEPHSGKVYSI